MRTVKLTLLFVVLSIALFAACSQSTNIVNKQSTPASSAAVAVNSAAPAASPSSETVDGKELYSKKCMICHKETGQGGKVTVEGKNLRPADLTSAKMKSRPDDKLIEMVKEGVPDEGMPSFENKLSDEQIKAIVQYVRTLQQ